MFIVTEYAALKWMKLLQTPHLLGSNDIFTMRVTFPDYLILMFFL